MDFSLNTALGYWRDVEVAKQGAGLTGSQQQQAAVVGSVPVDQQTQNANPMTPKVSAGGFLSNLSPTMIAVGVLALGALAFALKK